MHLHKFERQYLAEIQRDLEAAAVWINNILERDKLHTDDTLVDAALASAYSASANKRIKVVINAINIPEEEIND